MAVPWDHEPEVRDHDLKCGGPGRDHENFGDIENFPMKRAYFATRNHGFWSGTMDFKLVVPAGTTDPILKKNTV